MEATTDRADEATEFERLVAAVGESVRRALVAYYGVEIGTEAAAEAMRYGWEHRDRLAEMDNPGGYLFRVGQSRARPYRRWAQRRATFPSSYERDVTVADDDGAAMLDLFAALGKLPPRQRSAVVLVRAHGYSYAEAAHILGITTTALTNHIHRGMARLRILMEVER